MTKIDIVSKNLHIIYLIIKGLHKNRSFFALLGHSGVILWSRDIVARAHIKKPPETLSEGIICKQNYTKKSCKPKFT